MNPSIKEITEKDLKKDPTIICGFCQRCEVNNLEWGALYKLGNIYVHYFCLLFSAKLRQNGEDDEGIQGFLLQDIKKEFARGAKLKCTYCKQARATVGCSVKACKRSFHYTCGYERSCHFQFIGAYEGYCPQHKPIVTIPLLPNREDWACPICFCGVGEDEGPICPPCCGKAVFHRKCVMKMATCHGYFFKCPLCNDKKTFVLKMRMSGVYVPERDAAWELDPNAFADQISQYSTCDAVDCLCPQGRNHHEKETKWNLSRCGGCGSSAMHKECGKLLSFSWKCPTCESVLAGTGLLSSQSSEDSDTGTGNASQIVTQSVSRGARISRPDFYSDEDYKSSSEDDVPVENVVEVIQSAPTLYDLENDLETPPPSRFQGLSNRLRNDMIIDQKKNLVYDGIHQKKYRVEGGQGLANNAKNPNQPSCSTFHGGGTTTGIPFRNGGEINCSITQVTDKSDAAVIVAVDINSLKDENFQEKIAELKNRCQQIKNKTGQAQTSEIGMREMEISSQCEPLDFATTPRIVRRKLDFAAKSASLPSIQVQSQNSLNLGSETELSQIDVNQTGGPLKPNTPAMFSSMTALDDSPELSRRENCSSPSSYGIVKRSPVSNDKLTSNNNLLPRSHISIENPSPAQNSLIYAHKSSVSDTLKDDIEIINLDETLDDDDDDIQICDYIPSKPPIKILSVTSLNPDPYIPKSAAFMSMLNRFNEHKSRPWPNQVNGVSKENAFSRKSTDTIEEVVLSESDDDDLEVLEIVSNSPLKQQNDNNGNRHQENSKKGDNASSPSSSGKLTRDWQNCSLESNNSKRPRLSPD